MRKLTVLMPTFNRQAFIGRAIAAVLAQDYENWELIIQNGGESIEAVVPGDKRIIVVDESDKGLTNALNKAMRRATGDLFCWANDDDAIAPGTFRWVNENLHQDWGYGRIEMIDGDRSFSSGSPGNFERLVQCNFVPQPSVYWTRLAYEQVGDMDESLDLSSDYEYWMRLWKWREPQFFDRLMAQYYIHSGQISQTRKDQHIIQGRESSLKYERLSRVISIRARQLARRVAGKLRNLAAASAGPSGTE